MNSTDKDGGSTALLSSEENHGAKAATFTSGSDYEEKTQVIYGEENVVEWALRILFTLTKTLDLCG